MNGVQISGDRFCRIKSSLILPHCSFFIIRDIWHEKIWHYFFFVPNKGRKGCH